jgi:hypothetical protein
MINKLENGNVHIEEYSFADFLQSFQTCILDDYRLDVQTNDNFPQKYGDYMSAILVPKPTRNRGSNTDKGESEVDTVVVEAAKPASPLARKRKE